MLKNTEFLSCLFSAIYKENAKKVLKNFDISKKSSTFAPYFSSRVSYSILIHLQKRLQKYYKILIYANKKLKKITSMKKLQIVFFSIFAILANVYTIASIIKSGEFYGWHIGFIAISAIAIALVKLSVNELKVK